MVRIPRAEAFEVSDDADGHVVAAWERHNAEALIELACQVPADRPFRAREVNVQLEDVGLALVRGTAHVVRRDEELVASRPADAIAVYAALRGEAMLEYGGARRVVHPGEILVCDVDRPFLRGFGHGLEELAVKVPRAAFADLTGLPQLSRPLVLDAAVDPYARALVTLVGRAVRARVPVPAEQRAVLELVSVIATEGRVGLPMAHRAAARAFIDDHLADPLLSAADVAAGAGVSERHLSRLFAEAGTSVPRHILGRRLDLAHSILTSADDAAVRTGDVAARCGFTSRSHFSRAFRERFGTTAGQARGQQLR
jgi:AraC-like DNA-binding protein